MVEQNITCDKNKLEEFTDGIKMIHPDSDLCPLIEKAGREESKEFLENFLEQIIECDLIGKENNCTTLLYRSASKQFKLGSKLEQYPNIEVVKYLLKNKTQYLNGDPLDRPNRPSLLHEATVTDNEDLVRLIIQETIRRSEIEGKPDQVTIYINYRDAKGDTALMWAAEGGRVNAARVILEECEKRGADVVKEVVDAVNNRRETALHWAAKEKGGVELRDKLSVARLLIQHGADVTIENNSSDTAVECSPLIQALVKELRK